MTLSSSNSVSLPRRLPFRFSRLVVLMGIAATIAPNLVHVRAQQAQPTSSAAAGANPNEGIVTGIDTGIDIDIDTAAVGGGQQRLRQKRQQREQKRQQLLLRSTTTAASAAHTTTGSGSMQQEQKDERPNNTKRSRKQLLRALDDLRASNSNPRGDGSRPGDSDADADAIGKLKRGRSEKQRVVRDWLSTVRREQERVEAQQELKSKPQPTSLPPRTSTSSTSFSSATIQKSVVVVGHAIIDQEPMVLREE
eukprot:jgi/Psemu1/29703/gm1.29703_g